MDQVRRQRGQAVLVMYGQSRQVRAQGEARARRANRHGGQVSETGSAGGCLLDDLLEPGGCAAGNGVSLQPESFQCGDVAGASAACAGGEPAAARSDVQYASADKMANGFCRGGEGARLVE